MEVGRCFALRHMCGTAAGHVRGTRSCVVRANTCRYMPVHAGTCRYVRPAAALPVHCSSDWLRANSAAALVVWRSGRRAV
jgi:hypothetical protein